MVWGPPSILTLNPELPAHCEPTGPYLYHFSALFHTCVPTPLALVSTLLGSLSILAWLFAQLPQIYKNFRLKSTSGLSIYFLVEWCLGDMSNLSGAVLTHQATWQIIIGSYYCFVDVMLVSQWFWYESLQGGKRVNDWWAGASRFPQGDSDDMQELPDGSQATKAPKFQGLSGKKSFHEWPNYGSIHDEQREPQTTSPARVIHHAPRRTTHPIPSPSPRTALFLAMVIALCSINVSASPAFSVEQHPHAMTKSHKFPLGTIMSWTSTVLYLLSRLPQLIKNLHRRSTAGLSPLLFAAAFLGNLFYSSSLLFNPSLWEDFDAYGGHGWAGPQGSQRTEWMWRALPFFLGAAAVLIMDAAVGVQFWLWGESSESAEVRELHGVDQTNVLFDGNAMKETPTGWMRGWVPSGSLSNRLGSLRRFSPSFGPLRTRQGKGAEYESLLDGSQH